MNILGLRIEVFLGILLGGTLFLWLLTVVSLCIWCCCRRRHQRQHHFQGSQNLQDIRCTSTTPRSVDNKYQRSAVISQSSLDTVVQTSEEEEEFRERNDEIAVRISQVLENTVRKRTLLESKRLKLGKLIGQGAFGNVYKGKLSRKNQDSLTVAVKTINASQCSEQDIQQFLEETLCMKGFHHRNVLSVIGLCLRQGRPHVVMQYMDCGDLKSYIRSVVRTFTVKDLLGYTAQVAEGMTYLQEQGFIHRDLAARNCVINSEAVVKVSDFGLARDIHMEEYYRATSMDLPLPVRWMSVESLTSQIFTHKSDVWSFGVLMWEVMTRGKMPYSGLDNVRVIVSVRNGTRLEKPAHLPNEIFSIMTKCWLEKPKDRPDFEDLTGLLNNMLHRVKLERAISIGSLI